MLRVAVGIAPQYMTGSGSASVVFPSGFNWDGTSHPVAITQAGQSFSTGLNPRDLVDPAIWTGPAFHVDSATGDDGNSGLGSADGDFSAAKRTIYGAFVAGNATGAPYRVLVAAGEYEESSFTRNGNDEPSQPVAVIGWGGRARYRTGPFSTNWSAASGTYSTNVSSVRRAFRTDVLTPEGQYTELTQVGDVAACAATPDSWVLVGSVTHVNIGGAPGSTDIALMRSFHGGRFLSHSDDFYIENFDLEGGITGTLHLDASASRNVVGVNSTFRYSAPSNPNSPLDAVRVRRTNGLVAFFGCDASQGAKDGWSFHEDGTAGMHVLLQSCTGFRNGSGTASSCNAFTTHDGIRAIVLNGDFGLSRNGTEVHCIQSTHTWLLGTKSVARDIDDTSIAFKCSNPSFMWLQNSTADAAGSLTNYALEANAGTVFTRNFNIVSGGVEVSLGGSVTPF